MTDRQTWDEYFMDIARFVATRSKDRSRKVGCVIIGPGKEIRATGYNGFPRGVDDNIEERHQRPAKYRWTEHAERNAIYNAARSGVSMLGCVIYLPWYPCMDCARAIVQSGITTVIAVEPDWNDPTFALDFKDVKQLFREAGVGVRFVQGEAPVQQPVGFGG
jgi:dCMP deaminase